MYAIVCKEREHSLNCAWDQQLDSAKPKVTLDITNATVWYRSQRRREFKLARVSPTLVGGGLVLRRELSLKGT